MDAVRRAVDEDPTPNQFLITGSATPTSLPMHSGAGRIVRLRLRPLSLAERDIQSPSVSLRRLMAGEARRSEAVPTSDCLNTQRKSSLQVFLEFDFCQPGHDVLNWIVILHGSRP